MGASDFTRSMDGKLTREQVESQWNAAVENSLAEDGHDSYSGGIGTMGKGVRFSNTPTFPNRDAAEEHLLDVHEKWTPAIAVRYNGDGKERWLVGGWVAE